MVRAPLLNLELVATHTRFELVVACTRVSTAQPRFTLAFMATPDNRELINRFYTALNARRFDDISQLVDPDVVQEWPQSGERIRGLKNFRAVLENFPELPSVEPRRVAGAEDKWVLTPSWTPLRITGSGDVYTVESRINYPSGEVWSGVSVVEFRNGKASKLTEYFAAPFPAAEWRLPSVEQIEANT